MKTQTFTILTTFTLFVIIGLALLPLLEVSLYPNRTQPSITVTYSMSNASGEVIDSEITTPLEGVMSTLSGLVKLKSKTGKGSGRITLTFDKEVDMDAMRFEVSALMRQLKSTLPSNMSLPRVYSYNPDEESAENLLIYAIHGKGDKAEIRQMLEGKVTSTLSEIEGVHNVSLSGAEAKEWHLRYDEKVLEQADISISDISNAFRSQYFDYDLGMVHTTEGGHSTRLPLVFTGRKKDEVQWETISFTKYGRVYYLTDLVDITLEKETPQRYVRINGLNTIYLYVSSAKGANQLRCGQLVKQEVALLKQQLPDGYSFVESYDATSFIKDEIYRIAWRIGFSLFLLLLFVFAVNRSGRYVLVTIISLLANLSIAFIFYYLFHIQIHIYSMAGITVSLGMMIDNTIVMTDHLKYHKGDRRVFLPILASTLTTVGSLVIVFFLDDTQRLQLIDFAYVISINLLVSLAVALFLIPALVDRLHLFERYKHKSRKALQRVLRFSLFYSRFVAMATKRRVWFVLLIILLFGLPMSKLPLTLEGDNWGANSYNKTIGSQWYGEYLKKPLDIAFGGFLNPFMTKVKHTFSGSGDRRTQLNIKGSLPQGATLEQINAIFMRVENFLAQYEGIEQYITRVYSPQNASIAVTFSPDVEFGSLPFTVKDEVLSYCIDIGPVDWDITGVGRGFDNALNEGRRNSRMVLYGYNLEQLKRYAFNLKSDLEAIPRVEKVFVNGKATYMDRVGYEYTLQLKDRRLAQGHHNRGQVVSGAQNKGTQEETIFRLQTEEGQQLPVILEKAASQTSIWSFNNQEIGLNESHVKMSSIAHIQKKRVADYINKVDMQYQLVVEFDFIGSYGQKAYILGELIDEFLPRLPIGYRLETQRYANGQWDDDDDKKHPVLWLLVILVIIYMICAILLESLLQPLAVILTIPISFIGLFITFFAFKLPFGDGGYAAMLLLSGLTVNSALYIINEFNNRLRSSRAIDKRHHYVKAYNLKIVPILLTLFSTMLGLVPFLFSGKKDPFWFSLAAGTIGGLAFSLVAIFVFLPLFTRLKDKGTATVVKNK